MCEEDGGAHDHQQWQLPEDAQRDNGFIEIVRRAAKVETNGFQERGVRQPHDGESQPCADALQVRQAVRASRVAAQHGDEKKIVRCDFKEHDGDGDCAQSCGGHQVVRCTDVPLHGVPLRRRPCLHLRQHHVEQHGAQCNRQASEETLHFFHLRHGAESPWAHPLCAAAGIRNGRFVEPSSESHQTGDSY